MKLKRITKNNEIVLMDNSAEVLTIRETQNNHTIKISLEGRLISDTLHDFQDELNALAIIGCDLRLDFGKVSYVSSSCIEAMINVQKKMDSRQAGSLTIVSVPVNIMNDWRKHGYTEVLMVEE